MKSSLVVESIKFAVRVLKKSHLDLALNCSHNTPDQHVFNGVLLAKLSLNHISCLFVHAIKGNHDVTLTKFLGHKLKQGCKAVIVCSIWS